MAAWLLFAPVCTAAKPLAQPAVDDGWRHYESLHFELYSRQNDRESRQILQDLELLRAVFFERFGFAERAWSPVTVYAFATTKDFKAYSPDAFEKRTSLAGFYQAGPDRSVIVLAPASEAEEARRVIFHEYVHHLFRAAEEDPATWFNEGMAELLAGIQIDRGELHIGKPLTDRLVYLQREKLLALDTLFAVDPTSAFYRSAEHTGLFYAQSWALLHYWYCGNSDLPSAGIERFVQAASQADAAARVDLHALFQECFGMKYAEMERRLQQYVKRGSFRYTRQSLPALPTSSTYVTRGVPQAEIRGRLAELRVRVLDEPTAKAVLLEAAAMGDPRAYEVLGAVAYQNDDVETAETNWARALDTGTTNTAVIRELALMEARTFARDFNPKLRLPAESAQRVRSRLLRSIEQEPRQRAAYEMLAWVEAYDDDRVPANINRVQQQFSQLADRRAPVLVALAVVRWRMKQPEEALTLLRQLRGLHPDRWTLQAAETLTAQIEDRPVQTVSDSRATIDSVQAVNEPPQNTLKVPSIGLPDDL